MGAARLLTVRTSPALLAFLGLVVALLTYPIPEARLPADLGSLPLYVPLVPILTVCIVASLALRGRVRVEAGLLLAVGLLMTGLALSTVVNGRVDPGLVLRFLGFFALPVLGLQALHRQGEVRIVTWSLFAVCLALVALGYWGFLWGRLGVPAEHALGYWGIRYLPASRNSDVLYPLTGFLIGCAALLFPARARSSPARVALLAATVFMGTAIVLSHSRSGWLGAVAGLVPLVVVRSEGRGRRLLGACGLVAACVVPLLILVPPELASALGERLAATAAPGRGPSDPERLRALEAGLGSAFRHPLGVGVGNSIRFLDPGLFLTRWSENAYVHMAAELGWVGGIGFLLFVAYPLFLFERGRRTAALPAAFAPHYALGAGIAVYLLFNVEVVSMFYWTVSVVVFSAALVPWRARAVPASPGGDGRGRDGGRGGRA